MAMTPACQAGYPGSNPGHCILKFYNKKKRSDVIISKIHGVLAQPG